MTDFTLTATATDSVTGQSATGTKQFTVNTGSGQLGIQPVSGPQATNGQGVLSIAATPHAVGNVLVLTFGSNGSGKVNALSSGVSGGGVGTWRRATGYLDTTDHILTEIWYGVVTSLAPGGTATVANTSATAEWNRLQVQEFTSNGGGVSWAVATASPTASSGAGSRAVAFPALAGKGLYCGAAASAWGSLSGGPTPGFTYTVTDGHLMTAVNPSYQGTAPSGSSSNSGDVFVTVAALITATGTYIPLSVATVSLPSGYSGQLYPATVLAANGGTPPYTWSVLSGALPAGLALAPDGTVNGTATAAGTSSFTAKVTDSVGATATHDFTIVITAGLPVVFNGAYPGSNTQYNSPTPDPEITLGTIKIPLIMNLNIWGPVSGETATSTVWSCRNWKVSINANNPSGSVTCYPSAGLYPITFPWNEYTYITTGWDVAMPPISPRTVASATYDNFVDVPIVGPTGAAVVEIMHHFAHNNRGEGNYTYPAVKFGGYQVNGRDIPVTYWNITAPQGDTAVYFDQCDAAGISYNYTMPVGAIDYLAMLKWLESRGYISATSNLTGMGIGFEVCDTGGVSQPFQFNNWWCQAG
jgi:Putative Ig domain